VSKFRQLAAYEEPLAQGYSLLPFRFSRLAGTEYVLTNEAGQFLVLDRPTIEELVRHRLDPTSPVYQDLKGGHFLIDADSSVAIDLLSLKVRTKMRRLADFTALHIFVVSLRCEHSCPYCQVSRRTDDKVAFDMSWEVAQRSLELVFRSPSPAIKIEFQGGEPLLNFPLIERIVVEAKRLNEQAGKQLAFVIATNLALLDENVLAFCRAHAIYLSTSLDGPRDLHNQNRPRPGGDSYERTINGIKAARAALGRDRVSALMTSTNASLGRVRDIIDEYLRQGFDSIFLRPLSPYGFAIRTKSYRSYDADRWLSFYFEGLDYIIELNKAGVPFVESYAATILTKMLSPFETGYVDLMSPAGIGIAAVVYNYNGDVYASDEGRMLAEMNDTTFRLGHVERNSFEEIFTSEQLLRPLEESFARSAPMCSECAFEPWCGADPVFHHATHGDFVGRKPESAFCHRNMAIFRRLILMMQQDDDVRMLFHSWANQRC
jgi:His-Xaa-Ser system radical SAM maturase HxsB